MAGQGGIVLDTDLKHHLAHPGAGQAVAVHRPHPPPVEVVFLQGGSDNPTGLPDDVTGSYKFN